MPNNAPSTVGTATDQPITPTMPRPNHVLCVPARCASSLRAACAAIIASKPAPSSFMAQPRDPTEQTGFHFRNHGSPFALLRIEGQIFPNHRLMKLVQAGTAD